MSDCPENLCGLLEFSEELEAVLDVILDPVFFFYRELSEIFRETFGMFCLEPFLFEKHSFIVFYIKPLRLHPGKP